MAYFWKKPDAMEEYWFQSLEIGKLPNHHEYLFSQLQDDSFGVIIKALNNTQIFDPPCSSFGGNITTIIYMQQLQK